MKAQLAGWVRWWLEGLTWFLPRVLRQRTPGAGEQLHVVADADGRLRISDIGGGDVAVAQLLPGGDLPDAGALPAAVREAIGKEREIILLLPHCHDPWPAPAAAAGRGVGTPPGAWI